MNLRPLMILPLIITLILTGTTAFAQNVSKDLPAEQANESITPDEEREAREFVTLLTRRWRETEDIGPLINEFYVSDFADRLRHEPQMLFFGELKPEILAPENRDDLQHYYIAMTNLLHLIFRLYEVYASINVSGEQNGEFDLKEMLPASIWELFKSNPNTNALINEELGEDAKEQTENPDTSAEKQADTKSIATLEQLRALTVTLEQGSVILRDHLKTLPQTLPASEIARSRQSDADSSTPENNDSLIPRVEILGEDFYGYPAGTRLICVNVLPFHIDLVRDSSSTQRLKVLSVHLHTD